MNFVARARHEAALAAGRLMILEVLPLELLEDRVEREQVLLVRVQRRDGVRVMMRRTGGVAGVRRVRVVVAERADRTHGAELTFQVRLELDVIEV